MSLRVGLVGCGAVSRVYYADALATVSDEDSEVAVTTLFDPDASALEQLASRFPQASATTSWERCMAAPLDIAVIASPPARHAEQVIALLDAGVAVLCEKPLAVSVRDAESIVAASERPNALLAVGMIRRHLPSASMIRWLIRSGALGEVSGIHWLEGGRFHWPIQSLAYFRAGAGGVFTDIGVHVIDLLFWWLGDLTLLSYEDDNLGGIETNCLVRLRSQSGTTAAIRLTRDDDPPVCCRIECDHGTILWRDGHPTDLELLPAGAAARTLFPRGVESLMATTHSEVWSFERAFVAQLQDLIGARRQQRAPMVTARSALASTRLIDTCYGSRKSLRMPWLTPAELRRADQLAAVRS